MFPTVCVCCREYTKLQELETAAKTSGAGKWCDNPPEDAVRSITWTVENLQHFVEKNHGQEINAIVEHIRDGSTIRVFLLPSFVYLTVAMSGVKAQGFKRDGEKDVTEPFAEEARFFTEVRLLQRDIKLRIEGVSNQNVVATVIHPAGNIAELLLKEGFARCVDWTMKVVMEGREMLRGAEKEAREKNKRIWKDYKPSAPKIAMDQSEFVAKVVEVVNGDALVVKLNSGKYQKIFFSSLRPPRLEQKTENGESQQQQPASSTRPRPLYDIPYMFDAREFLRKRLVGKKVKVSVDYVKPAQNTFPERMCCTVIREDVNMAEALISKGLARVVRHHQDDDQRSPHYDKLLEAESRAEKNRKGLHSKKDYSTVKVADFSGDPAKAKHFLPFLQRAGKTTALVEFVASGSRFRLYLPKDTCLVNFILAGVSCPRASQTIKGESVAGEDFGDDALLYSKELILQREVDVEVESVDRGGNFIGWLYADGKNLTYLLVEEGYGKVHSSADRSSHARLLYDAEGKAREARKRVWEKFQEEPVSNEAEEDVPQSQQEEEPERNISYQKVLVVGVLDPVTVCVQLCEKADELKKLMADLQAHFTSNPPTAGTYAPKRGTLCAAKYTDGLWYRAQIERVSHNEISVLYVDYGNRASLAVGQLATLPAEHTKFPHFAKEYKLALVAAANDEDWKKDALAALEKMCEGVCEMNMEYSQQGQEFISLLSGEGADVSEQLVKDGLLQVLPRKGKKLSSLVNSYISAQDKARKERLNIWCYGDFRED
jgi:staphylococcal nuclease domain-containing protein 1